MTYVPAPKFDLPRRGEHPVSFVSETYLGELPNTFDPNGKPKKTVKLCFEILDENDPESGKPLRVYDKVTLTRHRKGNLIDYVRALSYPEPITPNSWELQQYIGRKCGLEIVHAVKPEATYANVARVFILPQDYGQPKPVQSTAQAERAARPEGEPLETGQSVAVAQVPLG